MAKDGGLSVGFNICMWIGDFMLPLISPIDTGYRITDRFTGERIAKCGYFTTEEYLMRLLLLPRPTIPNITIPEHPDIRKKRDYICIGYLGHNYYICEQYIVVCDIDVFRIVDRGETFSIPPYRYTDDCVEQLIRLVMRE
jgi:hypothetical protein